MQEESQETLAPRGKERSEKRDRGVVSWYKPFAVVMSNRWALGFQSGRKCQRDCICEGGDSRGAGFAQHQSKMLVAVLAGLLERAAAQSVAEIGLSTRLQQNAYQLLVALHRGQNEPSPPVIVLPTGAIQASFEIAHTPSPPKLIFTHNEGPKRKKMYDHYYTSRTAKKKRC